MSSIIYRERLLPRLSKSEVVCDDALSSSIPAVVPIATSSRFLISVPSTPLSGSIFESDVNNILYLRAHGQLT